MLRHISSSLCVFLACGLAVLLSGCKSETADKPGAGEHAASGGQTEQPGENAHEEPASFSEGVALLKDHYQKIKDAFESGNDDDAHEPLHGIGHVLESLPKLGAAAELSDEQNEAVKQAVDKMFDAYGAIDGALHKGEKADYAGVASALDENMTVLEEAAGTQ